MGSTNTIKLAPEVVTQLSVEFTKLIKESGLMLLPENVAKFSYKFYEERKAALKKSWVTSQEAAKYELMVGETNYQTIKNKVLKFGNERTDYYYHQRGTKIKVLMISTKFIKSYNKKKGEPPQLSA